MHIGFAIIGAILGAVIADGGFHTLGAAVGAFLGIALARISHLQKRVTQMENRLAEIAAKSDLTDLPSSATSSKAELMADSPVPTAKPPDQELPGLTEPPTPANAALTLSDDTEIPLSASASATEHKQATAPSAIQKSLKKALGWFTGGNVPVKIGVIISFFGVSFLLKYAIERELVIVPLEFRLLAVAMAGLAMIVIGWRLRSRLRSYSLSLQGGGIGILFLTIFAAFRLWELLPATLSFGLLVALTFFTGALAVLQNARALAILGITGGFLAPVLTSTGQGSHITLFSYYLVLNIAILGISWFRAWRGLNLIGFIFTFVIASLWGYRYYQPHYFESTEPFLIAHFLFYHAIAILFALRQPPNKLGMVDGSLVFGMPIIAFALQASMLYRTEYGMAISAAVVALIYISTAAWLFRHKEGYLRLLTESYLALAVGFATITIPLALDARWTSAAWAVEGAALVWLGTRQQGLLAKLVGIGLIFFSGLAFAIGGWHNGSGPAVVNGNVLGGLLISLSGLFASRKLKILPAKRFTGVQNLTAVTLFIWGVLWWLGTGLRETEDRLNRPDEGPVYLVFFALSMVVSALLGRKLNWKWLRWTSMAMLPFMVWTGIYQIEKYQHLLADLGWFAWPLAWAAQIYLLRHLDQEKDKMAGILHFATVIFLCLFLASDAAWWTSELSSVAFAAAIASVIPGVMAMMIWRFRTRPDWPVPQHPDAYLAASILLVTGQCLFLAWSSLIQPGNPDPLPYIPVLNPLDLSTLFAALTAYLSIATLKQNTDHIDYLDMPLLMRSYQWLLALVFFVLSTFALVRGVHQYSDVPWGMQQLYRSDLVQTALSIYWGLLGFGGMIWGARKANRWIWFIGVGFMALVVIKLFLVDLGNSGTIERIISFIGIGVLLLVVGYFAPAPPRYAGKSEPTEAEAQQFGKQG